MSKRTRLAVIGAGLSGLTVARALSDIADITVLEKSRGVGGRMSTRRAEAHRFDHGAQYFTAHGADFQNFLAPMIADGSVREWTPRLVTLGGEGKPVGSAPRYVATPAMNNLCKAMSAGLSVTTSAEVAALQRGQGDWTVLGKSGDALGDFDWVVSSAPSVQTARFMPAAFSGHDALSQARMQGCYSLMIGGSDQMKPDWDAARVANSPLVWIACNSSKPGRETPVDFICQTSNDWAEANLERDQDAVRSDLVAAFVSATGIDVAQADYIALHRWRFASVSEPAGAPYLLDAGNGLAACGDWCGTARVEAAYDSGLALASALREQLV
jgi:predicted NAD/FAD-dependent oxidoreductase